MPVVRGPVRWIVAIVVLIIVVAVAFGGYAWTRQPLVAVALDLGTNGAPRLHALRVRYAPGGEVYASLRLENRSRLPVELVDLVPGDPSTPTGYYPAELRVLPDEGPAPVSDDGFEPLTLDGGESLRVVVVYLAAPCEALADQAAPNTFSTFASVSLRIRVLGLLPKTQVLSPGRMFAVPVPSQADC
jgi:hypothetical protein